MTGKNKTRMVLYSVELWMVIYFCYTILLHSFIYYWIYCSALALMCLGSQNWSLGLASHDIRVIRTSNPFLIIDPWVFLTGFSVFSLHKNEGTIWIWVLSILGPMFFCLHAWTQYLANKLKFIVHFGPSPHPFTVQTSSHAIPYVRDWS